jgi:abortive infection bacteriophage resistance protein
LEQVSFLEEGCQNVKSKLGVRLSCKLAYKNFCFFDYPQEKYIKRRFAWKPRVERFGSHPETV